MKRKALVTGATGYVGTKLCQRLANDGWSVDVLVRSSGRTIPTSILSDVTTHFYDGCTESVSTVIDTIQPDVVFHLASLFIAEHSSAHVTDLINSNVLFGTQVAEGCIRAGVKNLINTGTSWQHYRNASYDPVCLYAATKQAFEDILDFYTDAFPLRAITLKLFDTYGPDDPRSKLVNLLINTTATGEQLKMSPGAQCLDLVHIDDVTEAFIRCAYILLNGDAGSSHLKYVASSGSVISVQSLVAMLGEITGSPLNVTFGERAYRNREVMMPWQGGVCPPGWAPRVALASGLTALLRLNPEELTP